MLAQKDVTKFLGIPVDGTKAEMKKKLQEKGFVFEAKPKEIGQIMTGRTMNDE